MPIDFLAQNIRITCPSCPPGTNDGVIEIEASISQGALEYSIDDGATWAGSAVFGGLSPGSYGVRVRNAENPGEVIDGGTVEVPAPICPEGCTDIDDPCGTVLFPGDLCVIGYDNYIARGYAKVVIASLAEIKPRTHFSITHAVYESGVAAHERNGRWYDGQGNNTGSIASQKILYKGAQTLPAGTVICFDLPQSGAGAGLHANSFRINNLPSSDFCVFNNGLAADPLIQFSPAAPNAVFLLQGDWTHLWKFSTFCGRVLCGLQDGGDWIPLSQAVPMNSRRSRTPAQIACFPEQTSDTPMQLAVYFPAAGNYTPLAFLAGVTDFGNWTQLAGTLNDDVVGVGCGVRFGVELPG
jgi:hypothetical protein